MPAPSLHQRRLRAAHAALLGAARGFPSGLPVHRMREVSSRTKIGD